MYIVAYVNPSVSQFKARRRLNAMVWMGLSDTACAIGNRCLIGYWEGIN